MAALTASQGKKRLRFPDPWDGLLFKAIRQSLQTSRRNFCIDGNSARTAFFSVEGELAIYLSNQFNNVRTENANPRRNRSINDVRRCNGHSRDFNLISIVHFIEQYELCPEAHDDSSNCFLSRGQFANQTRSDDPNFLVEFEVGLFRFFNYSAREVFLGQINLAVCIVFRGPNLHSRGSDKGEGTDKGRAEGKQSDNKRLPRLQPRYPARSMSLRGERAGLTGQVADHQQHREGYEDAKDNCGDTHGVILATSYRPFKAGRRST